MSKMWVEVTKEYDPSSHDNDTMCDWAAGCNNATQFRVTLKDGHQRYVCKEHLILRLKSCKYTHQKIEELQEV